jgi:hypothetical protein
MPKIKRTSNTTIKQIAEYWADQLPYDETELMFDWSDAEFCCWACGLSSGSVELQRCHIIPHALGGKDEPSNYVLLCGLCHEEAPNIKSETIMWKWLREVRVTNPYGGMACPLAKQKALRQFTWKRFLEMIALPNFKKILGKEFNNINTHGFHKYTTSTYYYLFEVIEAKVKDPKNIRKYIPDPEYLKTCEEQEKILLDNWIEYQKEVKLGYREYLRQRYPKLKFKKTKYELRMESASI